MRPKKRLNLNLNLKLQLELMLKRLQRGWSKRRSSFRCGRRCYYDGAVVVAVAVEVSKWLQHFAVICTINLSSSCGCFVVVAIIAMTLVRLWIFH